MRLVVVTIVLGLSAGLGVLLWTTYRGGEEEIFPAEVHPMIGASALTIPTELIRFDTEKHGGPVNRLDLLLAWPALDGADETAAATLRAASEVDPLVFVTLSAQTGALDSTERLDVVYSRVFSDNAWAGPAGLVGVALSAEAGYAGEELFFEPEGEYPFVTRCLASTDPAISETCMREIHVGDDLAVVYRFDKSLLASWRALDAALRARIEGFLAP